MNLTELQKTIHAINVEKGWHDEPLCVDRATSRNSLDARNLAHAEAARLLRSGNLDAEDAVDFETRRFNEIKHANKVVVVSSTLCPGGVYTTRVLAKLALVHTELCEAEDEYANDTLDVYFNDAKPTKPEGYVVELADAVIRAMDICESLGLQMTSRAALQRKGATLHSYVAAATEAARDGDYAGGFVRALSGLLHACDLICEAKQLDLYAAIELKIAYNRTRPHMHGGRLA